MVNSNLCLYERPVITLDLGGSAVWVRTRPVATAVRPAGGTWGEEDTSFNTPGVCLTGNCCLLLLPPPNHQHNPLLACSGPPVSSPLLPWRCKHQPVYSCWLPVLHAVNNTPCVPAGPGNPGWWPPQVTSFRLSLIYYKSVCLKGFYTTKCFCKIKQKMVQFETDFNSWVK